MEAPIAADMKSVANRAYQRLMKQEINVSAKDLIAISPVLQDMLKDDCSRRGVPVERVTQVSASVVDGLQYEANEAWYSVPFQKAIYAGSLAYARERNGGKSVKMLVDSGAMVSVMSDSFRRTFGLPLRVDGNHTIRGINGSQEKLLGISENVLVDIGGVKSPVHFFIHDRPNHDIVHGQAFLMHCAASVEYDVDGAVLLTLRGHEGRVVRMEVTPKDARYLVNVDRPQTGLEMNAAQVQEDLLKENYELREEWIESEGSIDEEESDGALEETDEEPDAEVEGQEPTQTEVPLANAEQDLVGQVRQRLSHDNLRQHEKNSGGEVPSGQQARDWLSQPFPAASATIHFEPIEEDEPFRPLFIAATLLSTDTEDRSAQIYDVGTKYKPVARKVRPVAAAYPRHLNPPMKSPPMDRDPYTTPLTLAPPEFVPTEKITAERAKNISFGPEGFLNAEEKKLLMHVVVLREKAFAFADDERGLLKRSYAEPYRIPTVEHEPWQDVPIPVPIAARPALIKLIHDRIQTGLYEKTESAYASKWFAVPKKDGAWRIVHSLERLNAVTIRDAGAPPVLEDFTESLVGRSIYGLLDIFGGYDERELHEDSRPLTAFQTPLGHLQLTRLPQGYTNAVAEQMRINRHVLAEEVPQRVQIFLDDNPIKGPESGYNGRAMPGTSIRQFVWEYAVVLERILFRLEHAGLTASGKKLVLATNELEICGTVVTKHGRRMASDKINKIVRWPPLRNAKDVRSFVGMSTVVRIHIPDFSVIAAPLRQLTTKRRHFQWSEECERSFSTLKDIVGRDIVLHQLDYSEHAGEIIMAVDSAQVAAGAALFQIGRDGIRRPARYESVTFTEVEQRYSQPKLELCGLVKCLKRLKLYLWGRHFTIEVDAQALIQMVNSPDPLPNAAMNRWLAYIALFSFNMKHVKAERHQFPDALSRVRGSGSDTTAEDANDMISLGSFAIELHEATPESDLGWAVYFNDREHTPEWGGLGRYLETLEGGVE